MMTTIRLLVLLVAVHVHLLSMPLIAAELPDDVLVVRLSNPEVTTMRLEVFDADTPVSIHDSGLVDGDELTIALADLEAVATLERIRVELRAWDAAGELVSSQLMRLPVEGLGTIGDISFDVIPAGTVFGVDSIDMLGDVDVAGSLSTVELRRPNGIPFFDSCPPESSIRTLQANGGVVCETDSTGGTGDNLGNHVATQTLTMGGNWIDFGLNVGIRSVAGAQIASGIEGRTFQFRAGFNPNPAFADIARFRDQNDQVTFAIPQSGSLKFLKGQKMCRVVGASGWSDTLLASTHGTSVIAQPTPRRWVPRAGPSLVSSTIRSASEAEGRPCRRPTAVGDRRCCSTTDADASMQGVLRSSGERNGPSPRRKRPDTRSV